MTMVMMMMMMLTVVVEVNEHETIVLIECQIMFVNQMDALLWKIATIG
jgi:hypothetical protein